MTIKIAVIIPVHNGATTIRKTLQSLLQQGIKLSELIIINDNSTDNSDEILNNFSFPDNFKLKILNHTTSYGLAYSYNEGIKHTSSDLIITLHQDVILKPDAIRQLIKPFFETGDESIVATTHIVEHPFDVWNYYNFWGKVYFAKLVGKDYKGLDGKFDCYKKSALIKVGLFDDNRFKFAGEDGDIICKLKKIGRIVNTNAKIIHIHTISEKFGITNIIHKQKQYSQTQGVLLRLGRINTPPHFGRAFFREILLISILIPYINIIGVLLITFYSIWYSKIIFITEYKDKRVFVVPFLNIYLLFVSFYYSAKGFIFSKQTI